MHCGSAHLGGPSLEEAEGWAHEGAAADRADMRCPTGGHQHAQRLHKDHHPEPQLQQGTAAEQQPLPLMIVDTLDPSCAAVC